MIRAVSTAMRMTDPVPLPHRHPLVHMTSQCKMSNLWAPSSRCPSQGGDAESASPVERPAKSARLQAVTQDDLYHNDASIDLDFQHGELDDLEGV